MFVRVNTLCLTSKLRNMQLENTTLADWLKSLPPATGLDAAKILQGWVNDLGHVEAGRRLNLTFDDLDYWIYRGALYMELYSMEDKRFKKDMASESKGCVNLALDALFKNIGDCIKASKPIRKSEALPANTSPFKYEGALFGAPVVTRSGRKIRVIHVTGYGHRRILVTTVGGHSFFINKDTGRVNNNGCDTSFDLFMLEQPPKKKIFNLKEALKKPGAVRSMDGQRVIVTASNKTLLSGYLVNENTQSVREFLWDTDGHFLSVIAQTEMDLWNVEI